MKLVDLFDVHLLEQMIESGYVRRQYHPSLPYSILNYTETAAFERVWNPVTSTCRGLIYNHATGEVVARPFEKFFNYGEESAPIIDLDVAVEVSDKLDGSLGILYPTGGGRFAVATRGSFGSTQAQHATKVWEQSYAAEFAPPPGLTMLFEIVYPSNRIVCDYGDADDLFLLGAVDIRTGVSMGPGEAAELTGWPGSVAQAFGYQTLAEALAAKPRQGAEGLVVRRVGSEDRIKIKQDDYVALHRIITNCTARRLWECAAVWACEDLAAKEGIGFLVRKLMMGPDRINQILAMGDDWALVYLKNTPEEFRAWVLACLADLHKRRSERLEDLYLLLGVVLTETGVPFSSTIVPTREDAKAFAAAARRHADFNLLMTMFRGQEVETAIWRELRPEHELPYREMDESVA